MTPERIHQIWIGPDPEPFEFISSWKRMHPGWEHRLWRERDIDGLPWPAGAREVYDRYLRDERYCGAANVARALILLRDGGVYLDADMLCCHGLQGAPFLSSPAWISQSPHVATRSQNAAMGGAAGNVVLQAYVDHLAEIGAAGEIHPSWQKTGAVLFDHVRNEHFEPAAVVLVPSPAFHPRTKSDKPNPMVAGYRGPIYARHRFYTTHGRTFE